MPEVIDTFFALDFDRCLGDYEASIRLTREVVDELSVIEGRAFQLSHDETAAKRVTFHAMDYIRENDPNADIAIIQDTFLERARMAPGSLLEPGAYEFMDFLRTTGHSHCIISFGDKGWQTTKINAAGLGDIVKVIVSNEFKSKYISEWFDENTGHFIVPGECFHDGKSKEAREIVLIDDKLKAFDGMHPKARGYLLQSVARIYISPQGKVPKNVKRVTRLDEIIEHESIAKMTTLKKGK